MIQKPRSSQHSLACPHQALTHQLIRAFFTPQLMRRTDCKFAFCFCRPPIASQAAHVAIAAVSCCPCITSCGNCFHPTTTLPQSHTCRTFCCITSLAQVQIWVSLILPPQQPRSLFQVTAELLTAEGKTAARSTRPHMPRRRGLAARLLRALLTLPFELFADEEERVDVKLFDR